ncbi:hypothetical protein DIPPA_28773 [Diplonema papillatum]|nr:hypothetical protein DIPPA_28773 [Diplonema papillatum]
MRDARAARFAYKPDRSPSAAASDPQLSDPVVSGGTSDVRRKGDLRLPHHASPTRPASGYSSSRWLQGSQREDNLHAGPAGDALQCRPPIKTPPRYAAAHKSIPLPWSENIPGESSPPQRQVVTPPVPANLGVVVASPGYSQQGRNPAVSTSARRRYVIRTEEISIGFATDYTIDRRPSTSPAYRDPSETADLCRFSPPLLIEAAAANLRNSNNNNSKLQRQDGAQTDDSLRFSPPLLIEAAAANLRDNNNNNNKLQRRDGAQTDSRRFSPPLPIEAAAANLRNNQLQLQQQQRQAENGVGAHGRLTHDADHSVSGGAFQVMSGGKRRDPAGASPRHHHAGNGAAAAAESRAGEPALNAQRNPVDAAFGSLPPAVGASGNGRGGGGGVRSTWGGGALFPAGGRGGGSPPPSLAVPRANGVGGVGGRGGSRDPRTGGLVSPPFGAGTGSGQSRSASPDPSAATELNRKHAGNSPAQGLQGNPAAAASSPPSPQRAAAPGGSGGLGAGQQLPSLLPARSRTPETPPSQADEYSATPPRGAVARHRKKQPGSHASPSTPPYPSREPHSYATPNPHYHHHTTPSTPPSERHSVAIQCTAGKIMAENEQHTPRFGPLFSDAGTPPHPDMRLHAARSGGSAYSDGSRGGRGTPLKVSIADEQGCYGEPVGVCTPEYGKGDGRYDLGVLPGSPQSSHGPPHELSSRVGAGGRRRSSQPGSPASPKGHYNHNHHHDHHHRALLLSQSTIDADALQFATPPRRLPASLRSNSEEIVITIDAEVEAPDSNDPYPTHSTIRMTPEQHQGAAGRISPHATPIAPRLVEPHKPIIEGPGPISAHGITYTSFSSPTASPSRFTESFSSSSDEAQGGPFEAVLSIHKEDADDPLGLRLAPDLRITRIHRGTPASDCLGAKHVGCVLSLPDSRTVVTAPQQVLDAWHAVPPGGSLCVCVRGAYQVEL